MFKLRHRKEKVAYQIVFSKGPLKTGPICTLMNMKSGAQRANELRKKLLEDNCQTFDLNEFATNEDLILELEKVLLEEDMRVILAGGDGTVAWGFEILDRVLKSSEKLSTHPPVAILPLGTGNELSGCLGWERRYRGQLDNMAKFRHETHSGNLVGLDRWDLDIVPLHEQKIPADGPESFATETDDFDTELEPPLEFELAHLCDQPPIEKKMYCFFSIGFDAKIAHRVHLTRQESKKQRSVRKMKLLHARYGLDELFTRISLNDVVSLKVDGREIKIAKKIGILHIMNIYTSADGIDYIAPHRKSKKHDSKDVDFANASPSDGMLEIVGTKHIAHFATNKLKLSHALRIAQGKKVEIELRERMTVQCDGEPWIQAPSFITITHHDMLTMIQGSKQSRFTEL